ncbi:MAG: TolC family protein, partial [Syntrophobacteraceae bacterium]|nr:TolC family protein [Syntrophobacteraceae bacterium]
SLVAYAKEQEHRQLLEEAVSQNRKAVALAKELYSAGQTDFLNVLSAQGALFLSEEALARSTRTLSLNLVALYKALGGGWEGWSEDGMIGRGGEAETKRVSGQPAMKDSSPGPGHL